MIGRAARAEALRGRLALLHERLQRRIDWRELVALEQARAHHRIELQHLLTAGPEHVCAECGCLVPVGLCPVCQNGERISGDS